MIEVWALRDECRFTQRVLVYTTDARFSYVTAEPNKMARSKSLESGIK